MTAEELIDGLVARGTGRARPTGSGVEVAGIAVVATSQSSDRALRRVWREEQGGGSTPVLMVADDPQRAGCVVVLGPNRQDDPIRTVEAGALAESLAALEGKRRLDAVRELATEIERLDQAGIPGLRVRGLLTTHTLDVRVRRDDQRWNAAADATKAIERTEDWRVVLDTLGYDVERLPQRGHLARYEGRPIAVVHPKADAAEFSRLDPDGRPPEGALLNDCQTHGAPYGFLASGGRLRLFEAEPTIGSAAAAYLELDAARLQVDDRPFLALFSPEYLAHDAFGQLAADARAYGSKLRLQLDATIRERALPQLGAALSTWARATALDVSDDAAREELERAALTLLFRLLFTLYAEGAGHLPMSNHAYQRASLTALIDEAAETTELLSPDSTALWASFVRLIRAVRDGNPAWDVPAYNGALFAPDEFEGAATLERLELADPEFGSILVGLGKDPDTGLGVDYSTLEIGHLGHIYEGLLSLRLSAAEQSLRYDRAKDRYVPAGSDDEIDVAAGDLLWQTHEGGRKGGGVYYTRTELVRHLVRQAVVEPFELHLDGVKELATTDPVAAAEKMFDFAILDPACGSAHFLVEVVDVLADRVTRFLAETPLPAVVDMVDRLRAGASPGTTIEDVALLRRLLLKRCVYGVDVSPMGAEVAKLSLWLASFVPGLSLAYLDRNVVVGNSLVGVVRPQALESGDDAKGVSWLDASLETALAEAADAAARLARSDDRTKDEVEASRAADNEARAATLGLTRLFDLWTAEPFGVTGARQHAQLHGPAVLGGETVDLTTHAEEQARRHRFLHWNVAFPGVFSRVDRPGFDAVIGNPPWEEVTIEELAFYARYQPGLRGLSTSERTTQLASLKTARPELAAVLEAEQRSSAEMRGYFPHGEYEPMTGDPDLYKFFCQRYRELIREGGRLGVVLPRPTFITKGSRGFRQWLFEDMTTKRVDFLLNSGRWAFDSEPRYTVALVSAERTTPPDDHRVEVAGTATSLEKWEMQTTRPGVRLTRDAFGPNWMTPLLRDDREVGILAKMRETSLFPFGSAGRWQCFPVSEFHETKEKKLWEDKKSGWPLWKGESFDQYDPHGAEARVCPPTKEAMAKALKSKPGSESELAGTLPLADRKKFTGATVGNARIAFRDVSRATDSRTARACVVPPQVFLVNSAPYLVFASGSAVEAAACLGVMNSLPFDWQARAFVESHMNFFIVEALTVPDLDDDAFNVIANASSQLSSVDDRFANFAAEAGVECGALDDDARTALRVEIDAQVAHAWKLTPEELEVIYLDFTLSALPATYRAALTDRLAELG